MKINPKSKDVIIIGTSIFVVTMLHYFTITTRWAEIHNFYRLLYYIPIIIASFKFRLNGGIITPIIISILYAPHLIVYFGRIDMATLNQILEVIMFLVVGVITGFLVESDYRKKNMLEYQIKKLTDLENYTQNILDSISNVLIAVDMDLKIQSINKEGKKIFGIDDKVIDRELSDFFKEYDRIKELLKDIINKEEKKILNIKTKCYSKDGEDIDVKLLAYPLKNIVDSIQGIVIVLEDISEIKKLEGQVRRAEKLSAVGELASGVAHEIRNPMGIIKTISQTIYKEINNEEIKEGIKIIINEVDRANTVIKGVLDFAKPGIQQKLSLSLNKVIDEIMLITKKYAEQHNIKISYKFIEDIHVSLDEDKIKQAFVNIIFNSIQAMPDGGKLNISISSEKEFAKISFVDTGVGIAEKNLEKIFNPFYTTKDEGTGLGLAITHRIIEEHKGYIVLNSELGKGTEIDIYLPIDYEGEN